MEDRRIGARGEEWEKELQEEDMKSKLNKKLLSWVSCQRGVRQTLSESKSQKGTSKKTGTRAATTKTQHCAPGIESLSR